MSAAMHQGKWSEAMTTYGRLQLYIEATWGAGGDPEAALAALEEMRKDGERLDWMGEDVVNRKPYLYDVRDGKWTISVCNAKSTDLRTAIDIAMDQWRLRQPDQGGEVPAEEKTADAAIEQAEDEHIRRFGGEWGDEHTEERKAWAAQRAGAACQCPARIAIRLFLSGLAPASLGRQMYFLKDRTELDAALSARCPCCAERDKLREAHRVIIENLAAALMPDSPIENACAEFDIDAMGACQIIRRLRTGSETL
jgi:hypothetical protein